MFSALVKIIFGCFWFLMFRDLVKMIYEFF